MSCKGWNYKGIPINKIFNGTYKCNNLIVTMWPNAHNLLELQQCFNTKTPTCFGPYWPISRKCTAVYIIIQPFHHFQRLELLQVCWYTQTYRLLQVLSTYASLYIYNGEIATILHAGNDTRVGQLFYTTVHSLMMGQ